jgi:hypothetical protein
MKTDGSTCGCIRHLLSDQLFFVLNGWVTLFSHPLPTISFSIRKSMAPNPGFSQVTPPLPPPEKGGEIYP